MKNFLRWLTYAVIILTAIYAGMVFLALIAFGVRLPTTPDLIIGWLYVLAPIVQILLLKCHRNRAPLRLFLLVVAVPAMLFGLIWLIHGGSLVDRLT
jgi:hypothetical protein